MGAAYSEARTALHREVVEACDGLGPGTGGTKDANTRRADKAERESFLRRYRDGLHRTSRPSCKTRLQQLVTSGRWVTLLFLVMALDLVYSAWKGDDASTAEDCLFLVVAVVFSLDVGARIYVFGPKAFFTKLWNIFDSIVVTLTVVICVLSLVGGLQDSGNQGPKKPRQKGQHTLLWFVQLARIARFFRCTTLVRRTCPALRRITGENKRRFVDFEQDLDLDLAYITPRLIGMSVPAAGATTWLYRNPLHEVVRFFETYYAGHYLVINMCPELPYPVTAFETGRIESFDVQDHSPPTLAQIVRFLEIAEAWISAHACNVIAVHCRGGKGRTGSFCCACLLYLREAEDAPDALNYFAMQRTDTEKVMGKMKVQGVETRSQVRYVEYVDLLLHSQFSFFPQKVRMPTVVRLQLRELRLLNILRETPEELVAMVHDVARRRTLTGSLVINGVSDLAPVSAEGDILVEVYGRGSLQQGTDFLQGCWRSAGWSGDQLTRKESTKGEKPARLLYFYCHTSFMDGTLLRLPANCIDRGVKSPKLYNDDGAIELSFKAL